MFASNENSKSLLEIIRKLNTSFDKDILKQCEKELNKRIIQEEEIIHMGTILKKVLDLNGMPKQQFLNRLNRIPPYRRKPKDDRPFQHILSVTLDDLCEKNQFSNSCEYIRQIIFHSDMEQLKNCQKWMNDNSENLIIELTSLKFSIHSLVQIEESCYTIAIIVLKFPFVFGKYFKKICNFLLMIITEGSAVIQNYVDLRNEKLRETTSISFDQDTEQPFHFPLFYFTNNNCLNKQLSIAYSTLAFCLDYGCNPPSILFLLTYAINTKEVVRYCLVWLIRATILSIDKDKCKTDKEWSDLPWRIHNELIKLYIDKNSKIRNMVSDISSHIKQCSPIKLPFITKPVLDTVDLMTKVIDQKRLEPYVETNKVEIDEVSMWKKLLDLEKNIKKISDESSSGGSTSSKSKTPTPSFEEDHKGLLTDVSTPHLELFYSTLSPTNDLLPQHTRKSIVLPNLKSLMTLTKLRTQILRKNRTKKSKLMINDATS